MQISCIVLAAGSSRRFGSPKMRHALADGRTILQTTIALYQELFDEVLVVGHPKDQQHIEATGAVYISSPSAKKGMSQSLIAGVKAASQADAWLIALGDMPYAQPATIAQLLARATEQNIVVPVHKERRGNPVVLGNEFIDEILQTEGDRGAKRLLANRQDALTIVEVDDLGVTHDIDTPEAILDTVNPIVV